MASSIHGGGAGDEGRTGDDAVAAHLGVDDGIAAQLGAGQAGLVLPPAPAFQRRARSTTIGAGNDEAAGAKFIRPPRRLRASSSTTGKAGACDVHGYDDGVRNDHGDQASKHKVQEEAMIWEEHMNKVSNVREVNSDDETDDGQGVDEQDITVQVANDMITEDEEVDMSYVYSIPDSEGMKLWMYVPDTYATQVPDSLEDVQVEGENELTEQQAMEVDRADNIEVFEYQQYVPEHDQEIQVQDLIEETTGDETLLVHKEWYSNIEGSQVPDVLEELSVGGEEDMSAQESLEVEQDILAGESQAPDSLEEIEAEVIALLGVAGEEQGEANEEHNEAEAEHDDGNEELLEPEEEHDLAEEELGEGEEPESAVRKDMLKIMLPLYFEP